MKNFFLDSETKDPIPNFFLDDFPITMEIEPELKTTKKSGTINLGTVSNSANPLSGKPKLNVKAMPSALYGNGELTLTGVNPPEPPAPIEVAGRILKEVGQSMGRNIASAGITIAKKLAPKELSPYADSLKSEDFQNFFSQALFETVFGKDQEIRSIEDRIVEAEPKIKEWGEELDKVAQTPGLNARERFVTSALGNLANTNPKILAFTGIMGSIGMDMTPFGGLEKNALKAIREANTIGDALIVLNKMGVADDLAKTFAEQVVKTTTDDTAKKVKTLQKKYLNRIYLLETKKEGLGLLIEIL